MLYSETLSQKRTQKPVLCSIRLYKLTFDQSQIKNIHKKEATLTMSMQILSCHYTVCNISINCISNGDGVKYLRGGAKVLRIKWAQH